MEDKVYLFDTTLRDGQQTTGVNFSVSDKMIISQHLNDIGIDYVEGGWPGANPTDNDFFSRDLKFNNSKLTAFGMTRRPGKSAENDPGLNSLIGSISIFFTVTASTVEIPLFLIRSKYFVSKIGLTGL